MAIGRNTNVSAFDESIMAKSPYYDDFDPDKKFLKVLFKRPPIVTGKLSY